VVTQKTDDVDQSTGALRPRCGLSTAIPGIEARNFYPTSAPVGKRDIEGKKSGRI